MEAFEKIVPSALGILLTILVVGLVVSLPFLLGYLGYKNLKKSNYKTIGIVANILITSLILLGYGFFAYRILIPPIERIDSIYTEITGGALPARAQIKSRSSTASFSDDFKYFPRMHIKTFAFINVDSVSYSQIIYEIARSEAMSDTMEITGEKFSNINSKLEGKAIRRCFTNCDTNNFMLIGFVDDDSTIVIQKGY